MAKMLKHDRKVHTGVKDYECRVCDAEVTDIQIHMRVSSQKSKCRRNTLLQTNKQIDKHKLIDRH